MEKVFIGDVKDIFIKNLVNEENGKRNLVRMPLGGMSEFWDMSEF